MRATNPALLKKVEAVEGDITEDNLGIDEQTERYLSLNSCSSFMCCVFRILTGSVNVVFHCAATVRFDEELTKSVAMNVGAVASILKLAKRIKNLEVRYWSIR